MTIKSIYQPALHYYLVRYTLPEEDLVFTREVEAECAIDARLLTRSALPKGASVLTVVRMPGPGKANPLWAA